MINLSKSIIIITMKTRNRSGFTIMEVSLFLALSGFLMVGLIASANMSVNRQRYSDSVNSVSDFLRGIYTDVLNVSNDKTPSSMPNGEDAGRTTTAIYGKLLIFGEQKYEGGEAHSSETVHIYDVVGDAVNSASISATNTLDVLRMVNANIIYNAGTNVSKDYHAYRDTTYTAPWDATLENGTANSSFADGTQFLRMILIVRSPTSGTIHTYISSEYYPDNTGQRVQIPDLANALETGAHTVAGRNGSAELVNLFTEYLGNPNASTPVPSIFSEQQIDICVDSDDLGNSGNRRDVRVNLRAANSSGVNMVEQDDLKSDDNPLGSICGGKGN